MSFSIFTASLYSSNSNQWDLNIFLKLRPISRFYFCGISRFKAVTFIVSSIYLRWFEMKFVFQTIQFLSIYFYHKLSFHLERETSFMLETCIEFLSCCLWQFTASKNQIIILWRIFKVTLNYLKTLKEGKESNIFNF